MVLVSVKKNKKRTRRTKRKSHRARRNQKGGMSCKEVLSLREKLDGDDRKGFKRLTVPQKAKYQMCKWILSTRTFRDAKNKRFHAPSDKFKAEFKEYIKKSNESAAAFQLSLIKEELNERREADKLRLAEEKAEYDARTAQYQAHLDKREKEEEEARKEKTRSFKDFAKTADKLNAEATASHIARKEEEARNPHMGKAWGGPWLYKPDFDKEIWRYTMDGGKI